MRYDISFMNLEIKSLACVIGMAEFPQVTLRGIRDLSPMQQPFVILSSICYIF